MRMYAIYDKKYGYIGTTELNIVEVRALESDNSFIIIPVQGVSHHEYLSIERSSSDTTTDTTTDISDATVLNIQDMVRIKVSKQD